MRGIGYKIIALLILIVGVLGLELTNLAVWEMKTASLVSRVENPEDDEYNYRKNCQAGMVALGFFPVTVVTPRFIF